VVEGLEELRRKLAKIHLTLRIHEGDVESVMKEILEIGRSLNLNLEKRAEGYAFTPSHQAALIGLPHLRVARIGDLLTIWIRAPYALDEARCRAIGLDARDLYQKLLTGAREIAKTLEKYSRSAEFLQISLP